MIQMAGTPGRLRPHVKTYKCAEVVRMQLAEGISKFKCATLSEALMLGECGAEDVLLAYPISGPGLEVFIEYVGKYQRTRYSLLVDHVDQLQFLNNTALSFDVFIDLDVGMHRTGCQVHEASSLLESVQRSGHVFRGWHAYDGHIHDSHPEDRAAAAKAGMTPVTALVERTQTQSTELICGGSITFPYHASHPERSLSPGTTLLWDYGYASEFPDLPFEYAASVLTRVVSKPQENLLCLDLGYKSIASEMPDMPVHFPELTDAKVIMHSEEHMVISLPNARDFSVGDILHAIPFHICPTVALHHEAAIVEEGKFTKTWPIAARNRRYL